MAEIVKGLEAEIDKWITDFLQDWYAAGTGALAGAPRPADPASATAWYIALAGNLTWAVLGVIAAPLTGAAAVAVALPTVAAAVIGSFGTGPPRNPVNPTAKDAGPGLVVMQLAALRGKLEKLFAKYIADFALQVAAFGLKPPFDRDRVKRAQEWLWEYKIFPGISYEKRIEVLTGTMLNHITSAFADYKREYQEWERKYREWEAWNRLGSTRFGSIVPKRPAPEFKPTLRFHAAPRVLAEAEAKAAREAALQALDRRHF